MSFRDDTVAHEASHISALNEKLEKERAEKERIQAEHSKTIAELEKFRKKVKEQQFKLPMKFPSWPNASNRNFGHKGFFASMPGPNKAVFVVASMVIALAIGMAIHHEFYDIRDGYVTARNYEAGHYVTTTDSQGHTMSTYVPPSWSVEINFQGSSATWEVSEDEYLTLNYGDWYCARDLMHEGPCIRNRPAEF